jgi:hypothetical protein
MFTANFPEPIKQNKPVIINKIEAPRVFTPIQTPQEIPKEITQEIPIETPIENPNEIAPVPIQQNIQDMSDKIEKQPEIDNEVCKQFYESRTRDMIIQQNKSNLELFKTSHKVLIDLSSKMDFVESSLLSIARVVEQLKEETHYIKSKVESLEGELKEINAKKEPLKRTPSLMSSSLAKRGATSQFRSVTKK